MPTVTGYYGYSTTADAYNWVSSSTNIKPPSKRTMKFKKCDRVRYRSDKRYVGIVECIMENIVRIRYFDSLGCNDLHHYTSYLNIEDEDERTWEIIN